MTRPTATSTCSLTALAEMAEEMGADYLQNGSWEMLNNLSQMRERAQAIRDGLDFFGFAPDYVPLQAYEQLLALTEGPDGRHRPAGHGPRPGGPGPRCPAHL